MRSRRAATGRAFWWTRAKLTSAFVAINGVVFGATAYTTRDTQLRLIILVSLQVGLVLVYRSIASRIGTLHLRGKTRQAFRDRLWDADGKAQFIPDFCRDNDRVDSPESGGSFYRQVLGPSEQMAEALYKALSCWEGISMKWPGALVPLVLALSASSVGMALQQFKQPGLWVSATVFFGFLIPTYAAAVPEIGILWFSKRSALRRRYLPRFAILSPRTREDVGLVLPQPPHEMWDMPPDSGRWIALAGIVGIAIPVVMVAIVADAALILAQGIALLALGATLMVAAHKGFTRLVVNIIPFVKFDGPIEVSVLIDLNHRHAAFMSLLALTFVPLAGAFQLSADHFGQLLQMWWPTWIAIDLVRTTWRSQYAGIAAFGHTGAFWRGFRRSVEKIQAARP